jgi:hypothetical protein
MFKRSTLWLVVMGLALTTIIIVGCSTVQSSSTTTSSTCSTCTTSTTTSTTASSTTTTTTSTTSSSSTSTTEASTTTTTLVTYSISGTIGWSWGSIASADRWGTFFVGITTDESNLLSLSWTRITTYPIVTGDANSKAYTSSSLPAGNYYILAALFLGTTEARQAGPATGDIVGHYSNGYVPVTWGKSPAGSGEVVHVDSDKTSKDYKLGVIW